MKWKSVSETRGLLNLGSVEEEFSTLGSGGI